MGEGYAPTFKALIEDTNWDAYGVGRNPKCGNCMVHCGFEATAVNDAFANPLKALRVSMRGPGTSGPMAPEPPFLYENPAAQSVELSSETNSQDRSERVA